MLGNGSFFLLLDCWRVWRKGNVLDLLSLHVISEPRLLLVD
jgi:hypothetical protein